MLRCVFKSTSPFPKDLVTLKGVPGKAAGRFRESGTATFRDFLRDVMQDRSVLKVIDLVDYLELLPQILPDEEATTSFLFAKNCGQQRSCLSLKVVQGRKLVQLTYSNN